MELLSSSFNDTSKPIYLVMQTPTAAEDGYNAAGTSTFHIQQLPFAPSDDFHEYRFDWTKDGVIFYADGNPIISMTWTYPKEPGHLAINHWSNGNAMWSKGPPKDAAVTTIEWVKAYYNSTNQDKLARYATRCSTSEMSQICAIPGAAPSPTPGIFYRNGTMCGEGTVDNKSSDTVQKVTDHDSKTSTATSSKTIPLSRALDSGFFWLLLVLTAMLITRH